MKISESELLVLRVLWQASPLTIGQIIARVQPEKDWHENTIKTLVSRLLSKEHISRVKDGKQYFYSPVTVEADVLQAESKSFIEKFFGGKVGPMVAHFAAQKNLDQKDIDQINQIIKDLKDD